FPCCLVFFILCTHYYPLCLFLSFSTDTATTELYTLSLHDALPIYRSALRLADILCARYPDPASNCQRQHGHNPGHLLHPYSGWGDRKSTRLNSSHVKISYAVFCLKKKKKTMNTNVSRQHQTKTNTH